MARIPVGPDLSGMFLLDLTFLGWTIAGAVTFGIVSVLWTFPYYENTMAALYLELSKKVKDIIDLQ